MSGAASEPGLRRLEEYVANSFLLSLMLREKTMTFVKCVSQTYLFPDV